MDYDLIWQDDLLTIKLQSKRLDGTMSTALGQIQTSDLQKARGVTVDFKLITLMDSGGLVGLVMLAKRISALDKPPVHLKNMHESVEKLIRLSHLERHFVIETADSTY